MKPPARDGISWDHFLLSALKWGGTPEQAQATVRRASGRGARRGNARKRLERYLRRTETVR